MPGKNLSFSPFESLEIATVYSQISFSKICPPEQGFINPTVRQREIIQGKVVQIGDYPRD